MSQIKTTIKHRVTGETLWQSALLTVKEAAREAVEKNADLGGADLRGADLGGANLWRADLGGADIRRANLGGVTGNNREVKTIQTGQYVVNLAGDIMQIGCIRHTVSAWFAFTDDEIDDMDYGALARWKVWRPILKQIIDATSAAE